MAVRGVSSVRQISVSPQQAAYIGPPRQPVFSRAFGVADSIGDESPPFVFILSGHLVRVVAAVRVPASDNTVISLRLNAVEFSQVVIPAGQLMGQVVIDQPFTVTDMMTVTVIAGGTGAQDLTVIGDPR